MCCRALLARSGYSRAPAQNKHVDGNRLFFELDNVASRSPKDLVCCHEGLSSGVGVHPGVLCRRRNSDVELHANVWRVRAVLRVQGLGVLR